MKSPNLPVRTHQARFTHGRKCPAATFLAVLLFVAYDNGLAEVVTHEGSDPEGNESAVKAFAAELTKGGANAVGFLYYFGHGVSRLDDRTI
jgi:hypothetical protein